MQARLEEDDFIDSFNKERFSKFFDYIACGPISSFVWKSRERNYLDLLKQKIFLLRFKSISMKMGSQSYLFQQLIHSTLLKIFENNANFVGHFKYFYQKISLKLKP